MRQRRYIFIALFLLGVGCSCYVNRAVIDPYVYTAMTPFTYYCPPIEDPVPTSVPSPELPPKNHPLTLAEIIDIALRNTPETCKSWSDARAAAAAYGITQASAFPKIDSISSWTRSYTPTLTTNESGNPTVQNSFLTQITPALQLTYTIFDFGQRRYTSEAAKYALYFSDWTHNRTLQTIVQTITNDYYDYLYQVKLHRSIEENVATAQTTLAAALAEKASGTKDISDVLQAKTLLLRSQMNLSAQKQLVQISYSNLLNTMGVPSDTQTAFEPLPDDISVDVTLKNVNDLIVDALLLRPDLRAAEADVKSKYAEVKRSMSTFFPVIDYRFNYGRTYYQDWIHDKHDWTGVFTVTVPIFSGFSKINTLRAAKDKMRKSEAQLREKALQITQEITITHSGVKVASQTVKVAREFLSSSEQQYEVALKKYRAGLGTILDVVSAQDSLATARGRYAQVIQQWYSSLADLTYAIGYYSFKPQVVK